MEYKFTGPFHQSHIADYCTCPMYFRLKDIDGMLPETVPSYMLFGIMFHKAFHVLHQCKDLDAVDWNVIANQCEKEVEAGSDNYPPQRVWWDDRDAEIAAFIADAEETLKVYWSKPHNHESTILLSETEFAVDIGGFPFAGRIDQLREMPDGRKVIIDFKTGKSAASEMLLELGYQLSIYHYACEHGTFKDHGKVNIRPDAVGIYRTMDHLPYKKNGKTKTKTYSKSDERGPGLYLATRTTADIRAMIQDLGIVCRNIKGPHYDNIKNQLAAGGAFGRMPSYVYGQVACDACSLKTECAAERRQAQGDMKEMEKHISEEDFSHV